MNVSDIYRTQQSGEGNVDCHQIGNGVDSYQCATNAWRTSRRHFLSAGQGCGEYELICFRDSDEHKESEKQCDEIQSLLHEHPLLLETLPLMVVEAKVCQTGKLTDTTDICFSTMQLPVSNCCVCYRILGGKLQCVVGKATRYTNLYINQRSIVCPAAHDKGEFPSCNGQPGLRRV